MSALLTDFARLPDEATLYAARPWSQASEAVCSSLSEKHSILVDGQALHYLLEVELAREVVDVWSQWRGGRRPSVAEACDAVVHYARNDAYLPVEVEHDPNDS